MKELLNQLVRRYGYGPSNDGDFLQVSAGFEFEPHGQASETWGNIWRLHLPKEDFHWKGLSGWRRGNLDVHGMKFRGRTLEAVITQARGFINEVTYKRRRAA